MHAITTVIVPKRIFALLVHTHTHTHFWIVNHTQYTQLRRSLPFVINIITSLSFAVSRVVVGPPRVCAIFWSFFFSRTFRLIYVRVCTQ